MYQLVPYAHCDREVYEKKDSVVLIRVGIECEV